MRRLILTLASDTFLTEAEIHRLVRQMQRWEREGGVLVLPSGARLEDTGTTVQAALPDGVSLEGAAWAAEESCCAD